MEELFLCRLVYAGAGIVCLGVAVAYLKCSVHLCGCLVFVDNFMDVEFVFTCGVCVCVCSRCLCEKYLGDIFVY